MSSVTFPSEIQVDGPSKTLKGRFRRKTEESGRGLCTPGLSNSYSGFGLKTPPWKPCPVLPPGPGAPDDGSLNSCVLPQHRTGPPELEPGMHLIISLLKVNATRAEKESTLLPIFSGALAKFLALGRCPAGSWQETNGTQVGQLRNV